jgi:hypothetical protein
MFDSTMADMCAPSSTSDNAIKGKWVHVSRDLNLQSGMWHLVRGPLFSLLYLWQETQLQVRCSYCIIDAPANKTYRLYQISNFLPLV